ncbi:MAG: 1-acyl-sn-glycerol-3-phosphate acyltransferase [Saprospiraceae bacterium]|jgi:1-acyl-sn-glycerol-3-phosphate acyltransferase
MLYTIIKHILRMYFPLFFNKVHIEGIENVPKDQPVIFAVNHQNTLLDATLVAHLFKKNTYFLVRSDVFKGRFINWIFKTLYLIPISRGKDGTGNMAGFNKLTFSKCIEHLQQKKLILIFPEGESKASYQLLKLKKGVARLAFQAEMENDFELNLHVIPVTINYQNHFKGNSDVWIKYCDPILLNQYKNTYVKNPARTINFLVNEIEKTLSLNVLKFENHESSKSFFDLVLQQSISSTTELVIFDGADLNQKAASSKTKKKWHSTLFHVAAISSKIIFFPAILITVLLDKIIKDIDFKLSVISFSLLIFSLLQIFIITAIVVLKANILVSVLVPASLFAAFLLLIKTYFNKY